MTNGLKRVWSYMCRTKTIDVRVLKEAKLTRSLKTLDLTILGLCATVSVSIYVMIGPIASKTAGPGVLVSLFISALAAVMSGLCYAELSARIPIAGSAYVYTYATVGEFMGFFVGWNLIAEYAIGTALIGRAFSAYADTIFGGKIGLQMSKVTGGINVAGITTELDFLAFGICILLSILVSLGMKPTAIVNFITAFGNLAVILILIIIGCFYTNLENWNPFAPFGFIGIIAGAAECFYAFVGFDVIAMESEEADDPSFSVPCSILLTVGICFASFFGFAAIMTLMVPYSYLNSTTALVVAFTSRHLYFAKYIIVIGALCGLIGGIVSTLVPLPRLLYALAQDGLLFSILGRVSQRTGVPVISSLFSGLFAGLLALFFDLNNLLQMISIGTLVAYTSVVICLLLLRYRVNSVGVKIEDEPVDDEVREEQNEDSTDEESTHGKIEDWNAWKQSLCCNFNGKPTETSEKVVSFAVLTLIFEMIAICAVLISYYKKIFTTYTSIIVFLVFLSLAILSTVFVISLQPQNTHKLYFKVPFVPWLPALSLFVNIFLILLLKRGTWIRFGIWLAIGLVIYLVHGIRNSQESNNNDIKTEYQKLEETEKEEMNSSGEEKVDGKNVGDSRYK